MPGALIASIARFAATDLAPVWSGTPAPSFTEGVASDYQISPAFVADPNNDAILLTSVGTTLPSGITIVGLNLHYDGVGVASSTASVRLRATALGLTGDSSPFTVAINAAVSSADITTFTVEGVGSALVSFGHPFKLGDVPNGNIISVTNLANVPVSGTQCDVQARHSDNSARHAILSGNLTAGTTYKLRSVSPPGGTALTVAGLLAQYPTEIANVVFSGGQAGTSSLRDLINSATNRASGGLVTVESGPGVLGLEVSQDFSTHLRLTYYLRWYGGANVWCDYRFRNGYSNVSGSADRTYTATCNIMSAGSLTQVAANTVTHYNKASWHVEGSSASVGTTAAPLYVRHNTLYLQSTGALPNYDTSRPTAGAFLNTVPQSVSPMGMQTLSTNIDDPGAQAAIGLLHSGGSSYCASSGDLKAFKWAMACENSGMSYGIYHLDSANGGQPITANTRPTYILNSFTGASQGSSSTPYTPGGSSLGTEPSAHMPSLGYFGYLLTGNRAYLEEMHAAMSATHMWPNDDHNVSFGGMTIRLWHTQQIRTMAWNYRDVGNCSWITPSNHPLKTYWDNLLGGNILRDFNLYGPTGTKKNPLGVVDNGDGLFTAGNTGYGVFMHWFLVQAMGDLVTNKGLGGSQGLSYAQYLANFVAGLMGNTGEFHWTYAGLSRYNVATANNIASVYPTFTALNTAQVPSAARALDLGTQALATLQHSNNVDHEGIRNEVEGRQGAPAEPIDAALYYFSQLAAACSYLRELDIPGAWVIWYRLMMSGRWPDVSHWSNFSMWPKRMQHGTLKPTQASLPTWIAASATDTWLSISGTNMSSVIPNPVPPGATGPVTRCTGWACHQLLWQGSKYISPWQGGHGDYGGNEVMLCDLSQNVPAWSLYKNPSSNAIINGSTESLTGFYTDGSFASNHGYNMIQIQQDLRYIIQAGGSATWGPVSQKFNQVNVYDFTANTFFPINTWPSKTMSNTNVFPSVVSPAGPLLYYMNPQAAMRRMNLTTKTDVALGTTTAFGQTEHAMEMDPIGGDMLLSPGVAGNNEETTWATWSVDGTAPVVRTGPSTLMGSVGSSHGYTFDPVHRQFLYLHGSTLTAINPANNYSAANLTTAGSAPSPTADAGPGFWGKARFAPELNALIVCNAHTGNIMYRKFT